jgi:hypothetical protein
MEASKKPPHDKDKKTTNSRGGRGGAGKLCEELVVTMLIFHASFLFFLVFSLFSHTNSFIYVVVTSL